MLKSYFDYRNFHHSIQVLNNLITASTSYYTTFLKHHFRTSNHSPSKDILRHLQPPSGSKLNKFINDIHRTLRKFNILNSEDKLLHIKILSSENVLNVLKIHQSIKNKIN